MLNPGTHAHHGISIWGELTVNAEVHDVNVKVTIRVASYGGKANGTQIRDVQEKVARAVEEVLKANIK